MCHDNQLLGVKHWICWKLGGPLTLEELNEEAQQHVRSLYDQVSTEFAIYLNPEHLKSLPEIEHGHILTFNSKTG
jgi:hypothetical protein